MPFALLPHSLFNYANNTFIAFYTHCAALIALGCAQAININLLAIPLQPACQLSGRHRRAGHSGIRAPGRIPPPAPSAFTAGHWGVRIASGPGLGQATSGHRRVRPGHHHLQASARASAGHRHGHFRRAPSGLGRHCHNIPRFTPPFRPHSYSNSIPFRQFTIFARRSRIQAARVRHITTFI